MVEQRVIQRERLLSFLDSRKGVWVSLPQILALGIAQYGARIFELRHTFKKNIQVKIENVGRERHTYYRLMDGEWDSHGQTSF